MAWRAVAGLTVVLALAGGPLPGQDDFAAAQGALRDGRPAAAAEVLTGLLARASAPTGALLYDLGLCLEQTGELAQAAWHYHRARLRLPRDPWLAERLGAVDRRLGTEAGPVAGLPWVTPGELLALAALLQGLGLAGLMLRRPRPLLRCAAFGLLLLGVLAGAALLHQQMLADPVATVLARDAELRTAPDTSAPATGRLRPGERVRIVDRVDGWIAAEHADQTGWVLADAVGVID